jgi:iron-sulfur cluster repair protein YtfE (RIC family)
MTDHPLTDEICRHLADTEDRPFTSIEMDNMRAAADWQLEQVIEWLRDTHEEHIGLLAVIKDLREAMRPTTTQKDN